MRVYAQDGNEYATYPDAFSRDVARTVPVPPYVADAAANGWREISPLQSRGADGEYDREWGVVWIGQPPPGIDLPFVEPDLGDGGLFTLALHLRVIEP